MRVFGSVAGGDADSRSDVDLLVDLKRGRSLLDLARLQRKLEQLLTVKVDLVSPGDGGIASSKLYFATLCPYENPDIMRDDRLRLADILKQSGKSRSIFWARQGGARG